MEELHKWVGVFLRKFQGLKFLEPLKNNLYTFQAHVLPPDIENIPIHQQI